MECCHEYDNECGVQKRTWPAVEGLTGAVTREGLLAVQALKNAHVALTARARGVRDQLEDLTGAHLAMLNMQQMHAMRGVSMHACASSGFGKARASHLQRTRSVQLDGLTGMPLRCARLRHCNSAFVWLLAYTLARNALDKTRRLHLNSQHVNSQVASRQHKSVMPLQTRGTCGSCA